LFRHEFFEFWNDLLVDEQLLFEQIISEHNFSQIRIVWNQLDQPMMGDIFGLGIVEDNVTAFKQLVAALDRAQVDGGQDEILVLVQVGIQFPNDLYKPVIVNITDRLGYHDRRGQLPRPCR
jgi:hypothetical protein